MSHSLVASRILCKQDDIIPLHVSVKMSKQRRENQGQTLLDFFGKKLRTEVESESTQSATQSISIPSEDQTGSSKENESKKDKYKQKFQQLWLEKFYLVEL